MPSFDAAVVCLSNREGPPAIAELAAAGKHVLAEKPVAAGAADARQIADAVEKSGVAFQTGYMWRYDDIANRLKRMVEQGAFGKLISVEMTFATSDIARRGPDHYLFDPAASGGRLFQLAGLPLARHAALRHGPGGRRRHRPHRRLRRGADQGRRRRRGDF